MIKIKSLTNSKFTEVKKEDAIKFAIDMYNKYQGSFPEKVRFVNKRIDGACLYSLCPRLYITDKKKYENENIEFELKMLAYRNVGMFTAGMEDNLSLYGIIKKFNSEIKNAEHSLKIGNQEFSKIYLKYYIQFLTASKTAHEEELEEELSR